jgi:uncharacterized protein
MLFEIHGEKNANDKRIFYYDNMSNMLSDESGHVYQYSTIPPLSELAPDVKPYVSFDKNTPLKKSKEIHHLKIQLGLSCNYTCDYCSQKFVERAPETSRKDIDSFLSKLNNLDFNEQKGLLIELWGGEPLVYWKTMKPLAEALLERFSHWKQKPRFSIITNGSILTDEMIDWLMMMDFSISISHDGPGQHVRGPDPFDDPEQKERILNLYRMMTRLGKNISFNSMLNAQNMSRKSIHDWFVNLTGDENVRLGEGSMVDAYDEDGVVNSLTTHAQHFEFRRTAFSDIFVNQGKIGFGGQLSKIDGFTRSVLAHFDSKYLGQKCGMDDENTIAVDLRGNVMTCQNVSSLETSKNDEPHLGGTLDDYENVALKSVTHWSKRKECPECPVLHLCKGACMFLDKKFWDISCANAYSDNVALFALSMQKMTGYIPTLIKSDTLPLERQDIFGTIFEHKDDPKKKIFPIKVVHEVTGKIDDVEVYGKSQIVL